MRRLALAGLAAAWLTAGGPAFGYQSSLELSSPGDSPYPPVVSQPLDSLPAGAVAINAGHETYYYYDGVFYQELMRDQKYVAVPAPVGAVIFDLPKGYQYISVDGISYYLYKGVYYKRVLEGFRVIYPPGK